MWEKGVSIFLRCDSSTNVSCQSPGPYLVSRAFVCLQSHRTQLINLLQDFKTWIVIEENRNLLVIQFHRQCQHSHSDLAPTAAFSPELKTGFFSLTIWEVETNLVKPDPLIFVVIQQLLQQRPALARDLESGSCMLTLISDIFLQTYVNFWKILTHVNFNFWKKSSKDINMNQKKSVMNRASTCFWCLGCKPMMMSSSPLKGTSPPTCSSNKICIFNGAQQFRSPIAEQQTRLSLVKRQRWPC